MKIVLLSSADCVHTLKWANGIAKYCSVVLITQQEPLDGYSENIEIIKLKYSGNIGYILNSIELRLIVKNLSYDQFHVHYASGYGTLANLAGIKNYIISVWGADVYDFPKVSFIHKCLVQKNINKSKLICSTSEVMKLFVESNFNIRAGLEIKVIPFGVDVDMFKKTTKPDREYIVIGTVKTLRPKYGIDILIRSFALLKSSCNVELKLKIAGIGYQKNELISLCKSLGIQDSVDFLGWVENCDVPEVLNDFDIYVAPSTLDSESFGVAIVEASSTGLPVVVSNVGGLPEVVENGITGFIAKPSDVMDLHNNILKLIQDKEIRQKMGHAGIKRVKEKYDWNVCLNDMIKIYKTIE